jgi:nucleotide-binding universal stress UspA family protein
MLPIRTILHPTDFSESAAFAYRLACSLARDSDSRLILLHVIPPPIAHGEVVARRAPDGYQEELQQALGNLPGPANGVELARRLEDGDPAEVIVRVARETPCDVIVMGTHGRTGLGRLLFGSVAEAVVRRAPCPVLTVKASACNPHPEKAAPEVTGKQSAPAGSGNPLAILESR